MLDRGVFMEEWRALCQRFNREPNGTEAARYYRWLKGRTTTERFQAAAEEAWARGKWFPRPADLTHARRRNRYNGHPPGMREQLRKLDAAYGLAPPVDAAAGERKLLKSAGGRRET